MMETIKKMGYENYIRIEIPVDVGLWSELVTFFLFNAEARLSEAADYNYTKPGRLNYRYYSEGY
jgi:hypothetical protein